MDRTLMLQRARETRDWEVIVVGGGATGLGTAVDAASRGYRTLLLERADFAQGTSSRSTKLVHGGVRYLRQGNISLVIEALRERGVMYRNAPHLVNNLAFIVPCYHWWEGPFYGIGLKLYDLLAGRLNLARARSLSREETLQRIPNLESEDLDGGVLYYDGQFDDARMALALALTAADYGAVVLNYVNVTGFIKSSEEMVSGVVCRDEETGEELRFASQVVINATGVFTDTLRRLDDPRSEAIVTPSQGVHLVLDASFLPGDAAIMVPNTDDGRVLFAIPWQDRALVGTTDTELDEASIEPRAQPQEIRFILRNIARYLRRDPSEADVLSVFAGLRPLVSIEKHDETKAFSREHEVLVSRAGLVSVVGGKWTTYRRMAQDAVDMAIPVGGLEERPCCTEQLQIHGWLDRDDPRLPPSDPMRLYGADAAAVEALIDQDPQLGEPLHERLPYIGAQVIYAARFEMARTVEDVLARRTRVLLLDARAAMDAAPLVAALMAAALGRDEAWQQRQVVEFRELARGYLVPRGLQ